MKYSVSQFASFGVALLVVFEGWCAMVNAAVVDPNVTYYGGSPPGATVFDGWSNLSSQGAIAAANAEWPGGAPHSYPGHGTRLNAWAQAIPSMDAGSGDATVIKTANGTLSGAPYPASQAVTPYPGTNSYGRIYFGSTQGYPAALNADGGQLTVADATPLANLKSVIFQIEIGEARGYDFFNHQLPVLSFNGLGQDLAATTSLVLSKVDTGTTFPGPDGAEPILVNTYLLQWDLSSAGTINDFEISFNGVHHALLYSLRLDQYDAFQNVVPEPASVALLGGSSLLMLGLCWKRRRRQG